MLTRPIRLSRRALLGSSAAAFLAARGKAQDTGIDAQLQIPPAGPLDVVIDTDTFNEIDDQYAVAYALLSSARLNVGAIYAAPFLNDRSKSAADGMEKSYGEILRLLKILHHNSESFAYRGSESFLTGAAKPIDSAAARDLIARAKQQRDRLLYVVTLGAPTNVASAILLAPEIKSRIAVVWLGGTPDDWPSAREFNLQQDIHASRVLLDSRVPLIRIPTTNVAEHLLTTMPEAERFLKGRSPLGDYLFDQFAEYYRKNTAGKPQPYPWSKVIWDISTVAWLIEPNWVPTTITRSPVLNDDFTWSKGTDRHAVRTAYRVRRDEIFADLFRKIAGAQ